MYWRAKWVDKKTIAIKPIYGWTAETELIKRLNKRTRELNIKIKITRSSKIIH